MNPSYPLNGGPYPQHPHGQPLNPTAPPMSGHPHQPYPYPMNPYGHGYPPPYAHPQYQPMMMYPPPRQGIPEAPMPESSASGMSTGGKRKRKHDSRGGDRGSDDETGASGSDAPRQTMSHKQAAVDLKKRTKTVRIKFIR
jgi:hypothetical protein